MKILHHFVEECASPRFDEDTDRHYRKRKKLDYRFCSLVVGAHAFMLRGQHVENTLRLALPLRHHAIWQHRHFQKQLTQHKSTGGMLLFLQCMCVHEEEDEVFAAVGQVGGKGCGVLSLKLFGLSVSAKRRSHLNSADLSEHRKDSAPNPGWK